MRLTDLATLLWRRKALLLSAMLLAAVIGFAISKSLPPRYSSDGQLLVESRAPLIPELNQAQPLATAGIRQIRTEADILRSRQLAENVVRELGLADIPEDGMPPFLARLGATLSQWRVALLGASDAPPPDKVALAVEELQRRLSIRSADNSSLVEIGYSSVHRPLAPEVVNALMRHYIEAELASKEELTRQANRWLTQRLDQLRTELEAADQRVQAFRQQSGLLETSQGSVTAVQMTEDEGRVAAARQELSRAQSLLASANRPGAAGGVNEVLSSTVIQQLRDREAETVARAASLAERLGPAHPDRRAAEAELAGLRRQIGAETAKILAGLRRDVDSARARLADAEALLNASRGTAQSGAEAGLVLAQLTRDADAKRQIFQTFLSRAEQTRLASAQFPTARIISPAVEALRPSGPPASVIAIFAGLMAFFLVAAVVVLRHLLHGRIGSAQDLVAVTGVMNAGSLPALRRPAPMPALVLDRAESGIAETLRALRMTLQSLGRDGAARVVLVTSSTAGDGKTTVAASLARICAADGLRVLVIETDMRRPRLAAMLGLRSRASSLEAVLRGQAGFEEAVMVDEPSGLHCLCSDHSSSHPQSLLRSPAFARLVERARSEYQLVILDSPPVMQVADAILLTGHADAVLFAVRWERASRSVVAEALRRLPEAMRDRTATVLTRVRPSRMDPLGYFEGYAQSEPPVLAS
jgi:succinoglycan biosynthesis transport protein ExoP